LGVARPGTTPKSLGQSNDGWVAEADETRESTMKIHMDVECTPEEARTLFGLPDVKPMQKAMMDDIEARMKKALSAMEPEALLKTWLPASMQGLEHWQKLVWGSVSRAMSTGRGGEAAGEEAPEEKS
jgi:hypothetical protein